MAFAAADYGVAWPVGENRDMESAYATEAPSRAEVDALTGATMIEFGTGWCGWCRGAQPLLRQGLQAHPAVRHLKIEDGPGRKLGRSFGVKLWPTVVFMRDGQEVARLVRPSQAKEVEDALAAVERG